MTVFVEPEVMLTMCDDYNGILERLNKDGMLNPHFVVRKQAWTWTPDFLSYIAFDYFCNVCHIVGTLWTALSCEVPVCW